MPRRSGKARAKFTVADKRALNKVKRAVNNLEQNVHATAFTVDPNSSGAVVNLTAVLQGIDSNDRIGDSLNPSHIECRGIITLHASASDSRVRMMIVRDNFGTTTQPAITDMFTSVTQFAANKVSFGDVQSRARFTVIWDRYVLLDAGAHGLTNTVVMKKKLAKKPILYTGIQTTDEGQNNLYLFIASNEATNDPVVNIQSNFWYTG